MFHHGSSSKGKRHAHGSSSHGSSSKSKHLGHGSSSHGSSSHGSSSHGSSSHGSSSKSKHRGHGSSSHGSSSHGSSSKGKHQAYESSSQGTSYQQPPYQQHPYQQHPYQQPPFQQPPYQQSPYQQPPYQGSSSQGTSSQQTPHQGSSSQGNSSVGRMPSTVPMNWDAGMDPNIYLSQNDLGQMSADFYHVDFQISNAWLCFGQENVNGDVGTNHVFLKFDFNDCPGHPWRCAKLEARDDQEGSPNGEFQIANLVLGLRTYTGKPRGLKYMIELSMKAGGMTLGDLIGSLLRGGLTAFYFSYVQTNEDENMIVGCRDYVAQVLFSLKAEGFIFSQFKSDPAMDPDGPQLAWVDEKGKWEWPNPQRLFQNDIFAALACFYAESSAKRGFKVSLAKSSPVEKGFFPNIPDHREHTAGYPYEVAFKFGILSDDMDQIRNAQRGIQGLETGQNPTSQLETNTGYTVHPRETDLIRTNPDTGGRYFYHSQTGEAIPVDSACQPYPNSFSGQSSRH